jgi:hypothetical protein
MKKLISMFLLMTGLCAVANVALASDPYPECYPCPGGKSSK